MYDLCASKSLKGFLLLELSIVLLILGVMGSFALPLFQQQIERVRLQETKARQTLALKIMASYLARTKHLPCPADPRILSKNFGEAPLRCEGKNAIGIFPFKTLGLPESSAKDGHGRFMTYAVEAQYARATSNYCYLRQTARSLFVGGALGVAPPKDPHNFIMVVLVSHGRNGFGAFQKGGRQHISSVHGPGEKINADSSSHFVFQEHSKNPETYFDDEVSWATYQTLPLLIGKNFCEE